MKTIQISARLPEKQDIIDSFDELTNDEIKKFVCDFEGLNNIDEFQAKTIRTKRFGDVSQFQKVRTSDTLDEFYSGKTATVYKTSYHEGVIFFGGIHFKECRPNGIGYGINPDTAQAVAYCKKCNTVIFSGPDMIGRRYNWCDCR